MARVCSVKLSVETPIELLRFDPCAGPGEIHVESLKLKDGDGKVYKQWDYAAGVGK